MSSALQVGRYDADLMKWLRPDWINIAAYATLALSALALTLLFVL